MIDFFAIGNIKDLVETIFWIVWWIIGVLWLSTWKKQIKWNIEFDTARKILNQIYIMRRGVEIVRNPFMSAYEMNYTWVIDWLSKKEIEAAGIRIAYNNRFELLDETKQKILLDILEAEVLWWKEIKMKLYDFLWIIKELEMAISDYLQIKSLSNIEKKEEYRIQRSKEIRSIVYAKTLNSIEINKNDQFGIRLEWSINEIEDYVRKFLRIN